MTREELKKDCDSTLQELRMQTSYSDCASMPIPTYERAKDLIAKQDKYISELVTILHKSHAGFQAIRSVVNVALEQGK